MGIKHRPGTDFTEHPNGSRCYRTSDPFASVAKVENCPCEDGKRRNVFATAEPDTFFSIPACVYVGRKTVSGHLMMNDNGWKFIVDRGSKNAELMEKEER